MSAQHNKDQVILERLTFELDQLQTKFPEFNDRVLELIQTRIDTPKVHRVIHKQTVRISQDELFSILDKLHQIAQLPATTIEVETRLYLEQQLADILGFEVASTMDQQELPFNKVSVKSLPHIAFTPSSPKVPVVVAEAGINSQRSWFGWEGTFSAESTAENQQEYWIAFPFHSMSTDLPLKELKLLWKNKKVVLINPVDGVAVVAKIKDTFLDTTGKYHIGASPAVIREGMFWSPQNLGRCLLFFSTDQEKSIDCGSYYLF